MVNSFFYSVLDIFFNFIHLLIIFINCFGWAWEKTLKLNIFLLLATIVSWSILGIFFGLGFCFLTNIHFIFLNSIETTAIPFSYLDHLLIDSLDLKISSKIISLFSILVIFASLGVSIKKNFYHVERYIFWLLGFCCFSWLFIVQEKGIGFIPNLDETYIIFTLIASIILIFKVSSNLVQKNF